jgi:orotidine-5'-phosphate decarboxylase
VVCAVSDVATVKMAAPEMLAVTPGIRMADDVGGDQERIETPSGAVTAGADILVVGRPITQSPDPARAARMMADSIRNDL